MIKNYAKELLALAVVGGLISYGVYVFAAPKQKEVITATRGHEAEVPKQVPPAPVKKDLKALGVIEGKEVKKPAGKEVKKPVTTKEIVVTPDPKKDPNRKKPTLKKKYADKK
jgi:hypothetical protein